MAREALGEDASLAPRERGLKQRGLVAEAEQLESLAPRERGLKHVGRVSCRVRQGVARPARAWIETCRSSSAL